MPTRHHSPSAPNTDGTPDPVETTPATWWLTGVSFSLASAAVAASVVFLGGDGQAGGGTAQVGELVEHTRLAHEGLVPVVEAMEEFLPTDGSHPPLDMTDASMVNTWRVGVREAAGHVGEPAGGGTSHEVARAGLASSVRLLTMTVDTYAKAALIEDEEMRMDVLHIAMDLRDQAVTSWSVAATHLDTISVDAGHGHVHLYLPAAPDSGALQPDGAGTEGSGTGGEGTGGGHDH
ncbi:hypothetical protein [Nocardiopsis halotolerans]|uniref:hypothetical protein n=1 Tax=Nocardiopsis halotolerans TaxID=124252 RepID=UPI00034BB594|nr:hypothetical protein [Nocardiopsis halotolerans]